MRRRTALLRAGRCGTAGRRVGVARSRLRVSISKVSEEACFFQAVENAIRTFESGHM